MACFLLYPAYFAHADTDEKPAILSASEIDYPPFCVVDDDGKPDGFSVELLRAALEAMNHDVSFRTGPWEVVRGWLESGEVQALPLVGRTPEREELFDFTFPYMALHGAIVVRDSTRGISNLEDLRGLEVAVMKGDNAEEFLRRPDRGFSIQTTPTFIEALRNLSAGQYDAVVIQRLVALRLIQEIGLQNVKILDKPIEDFRQDFCFAVKKGDQQTLALLNEGLAIVIADGTYRRLHSKWFAVLELPSNRPIIVGGDYKYPPFEYLNTKGVPAGYNVDLTRAIAAEMGLDIEFRLGPWSEILQAFENGEIDVLQGAFYTPARDRKYDFSQPHLVSHYVGIVKKGTGDPPESFEDLKGKSIVLQRGDAITELMLDKGLQDQITVVDSQEDMLRAVSEGRYDCGIAIRVGTLNLINSMKISDLVLGRRPFMELEYCYATLSNRDAILTQFSEGLSVLEHSGEYRRIHDKWLAIYPEYQTSLADVLRYSALVLLPLILLLLIIVFWSQSLRAQVKARTQELNESLDRFQYIFESVNVGKSITLPSGEIIANQAFADYLGYTPEEMKEKTWQDLCHPEFLTAASNVIDAMMHGDNDAERFEAQLLRNNGGSMWADNSVQLRRDAEGNPLYFVTTIVDISERKAAEVALRENEEKFRLLADNTVDSIWRLSLEAVFEYINPACFTLLGYTPEEMIGTPLQKYCDDENNAIIANEIAKALEKPQDFKSTVFEAEMQKRDGASVAVEITGKVIFDSDGNPIALQGITRDITARKQAEEEREVLQQQLTQTSKMESVGRLAGGVAHDFNNILQSMMGYSDMLLEALPEDSETHQYTRIISQGVERAAALTRQLLAFARKQTINPVVLDINETVQSMLNMLRRLIGEDIELIWQQHSDLWPAKMDPGQVDQILANLCVNARDAIAGVGKVTIETNNALLDEDFCNNHTDVAPGEYILLSVSDDGCGMNAETCANIFEPFFTTKGMHEGTGLGLSMVYGIVKQNGGFINVESELGAGTTFKIYLPRYTGEKENVETRTSATSLTGQGETVLIVEDDAALLTLCERMLENSGYHVLTAATPNGALQLARDLDGAINLLVTDVVMPEMNGHDLAEKMLSLYPAIKVLFMSGYTADVIALRGVLDEGVHLLQKPFTLEKLAGKIREALDA